MVGVQPEASPYMHACFHGRDVRTVVEGPTLADGLAGAIEAGSITFDIGFLKIGADFQEPDRQCAWELYAELSTRVAVTGKPKRYAFRSCFIDPFQGTVMANFAARNLKLTKVAILKDIKNDYSLGLTDAFKSAFAAAGVFTEPSRMI